jgi:hypothetical protein
MGRAQADGACVTYWIDGSSGGERFSRVTLNEMLTAL